MTDNLQRKQSIAHRQFTGDEVAYSATGQEFRPAADMWKLSHLTASTSLNFNALAQHSTENFVLEAKRVSIALVTTLNPHTCLTAFINLLSLVRHASDRRGDIISQVQEADFSAWVMDGNRQRVSLLRIFSDRAKLLQSSAFSQETFELIDSIKVEKSSSYESVRSWDPEAGSYRPSEDAALRSALDAAFNDGVITLRDYTIARVFRGTGIRPAQVALLKVGDISFEEDATTTIRIPKVKDRGKGSRQSFMSPKPISKSFSNLLKIHIETNVAPLIAKDFPIEEAPLFVSRSKAPVGCSDISHHMAVRSLHTVFTKIFQRLNVKSPITGKSIHVNPRRERHTYLTYLAMNGCGALEIAANAGHSSPQSCEAYVDASVDHYQRMERLVGEAFIPMADRFLGNVTTSSDDQTDPMSHIFRADMEGVGSCSSGGCGAIDAGVAPFACYSCRKFNAWADAPHEELLNMLVEEQSRLNDQGHGTVAETKTQTIIAITDLLEAIRLKDGSND